MKITRRSPWTGEYHTRDLPITEAQLLEWQGERKLIQDVFPTLTAGDREFLMTGYTEEDWDEMFDDEERDEDDV